MVFHCRCFSFIFKDQEEEIEYETVTQVQATMTQTFYTASSNFNRSVTNSQLNSSAFSNNLKEFTFFELKEATEDFSPSTAIGEGGFGCVYTGVINDSLDSTKSINVAVKRLDHTGLQGHKEWVTEVNLLGVVDHPNLVKLVGYCADNNQSEIERLLVYEYMPNRSVEYHLSTRSKAPLSWTNRLKVAHDTARGLTYLHEGMDFQIIMRDFKSSNILLDDQWNAKLSDFGLARLGPEGDETHISTALAGTPGYTAPEYLLTGRLTFKSDVFSYGVFLFELITGRRPLDKNRPNKEQNLSEWVRPYVGSEKFQKVIDPKLEGNYSLESVTKLADIARKCTYHRPRSRPMMSEVLEMVNQLITGVPSPALSSLASVVAIEPKMVKKIAENIESEAERGLDFMVKKTTENMESKAESGSDFVVKKTPENMKSEAERGSNFVVKKTPENMESEAERGSNFVVKKTPEIMEIEAERGSTEIQRKQSACFSRISCFGGPV